MRPRAGRTPGGNVETEMGRRNRLPHIEEYELPLGHSGRYERRVSSLGRGSELMRSGRAAAEYGRATRGASVRRRDIFAFGRTGLDSTCALRSQGLGVARHSVRSLRSTRVGRLWGSKLTPEALSSGFNCWRRIPAACLTTQPMRRIFLRCTHFRPAGNLHRDRERDQSGPEHGPTDGDAGRERHRRRSGTFHRSSVVNSR